MSATSDQTVARAEARERIAKYFFSDVDSEIEAIAAMLKHFDGANRRERQRIIDYLQNWHYERELAEQYVLVGLEGVCRRLR